MHGPLSSAVVPRRPFARARRCTVVLMNGCPETNRRGNGQCPQLWSLQVGGRAGVGASRFQDVFSTPPQVWPSNLPSFKKSMGLRVEAGSTRSDSSPARFGGALHGRLTLSCMHEPKRFPGHAIPRLRPWLQGPGWMLQGPGRMPPT